MINYIFGSVELCVNESNTIGLLAKNNINCFDISIEFDEIYIHIPLYLLSKAKKILARENIDIKALTLKGLPQIVYSYRLRFGLIVGMIVFGVMMSIAGKYIWSFSITGNEVVSDETIISLLDELGCGVGDKIDDINFDELHNSFLIKCSDISWISVNMDGVVANVEVKETKRGEAVDNTNYNVVASEDGQIELITVVEGKSQVEIGDVVKKGDLLISGVESYREGENTFYKSAEGKVIAKVNRILKVEVNENKNVRVNTGNVQIRKSLKIFNFTINLLGKGGIVYSEYDIITENRQIVLFGVVKLPVWMYTETISEVYLDNIILNEAELKAEAIKLYKSLMSEMSSRSELVSVVTKSSFENGVYSIAGNVYCLTDIAEKLPYEIAK